VTAWFTIFVYSPYMIICLILYWGVAIDFLQENGAQGKPYILFHPNPFGGFVVEFLAEFL
jgi:hypothetical protein